jgi:hypothetical protein
MTLNNLVYDTAAMGKGDAVYGYLFLGGRNIRLCPADPAESHVIAMFDREID